MLSNATRNLLNPTLATTIQNGITCTNNGDGTYTLNGTATALVDMVLSSNFHIENGKMYRMTGWVKNVPGFIYLINRESDARDTGDGVTFTYNDVTNDSKVIHIQILEGSIINSAIIKPMICTDASATYDDFVPYSGYDIKTCGKNLLKLNLETDARCGVTFTKNDDGTCTIKGTATEKIYVKFGYVKLSIDTKYKLVGFEGSGILNKFSLYMQNGDSYPNDIGNGVTFTAKTTDTYVAFTIQQGTNVNMICKPMITTDLNATYDDYEQYKDGGTVHIDSTTEFPLLGLKSFDGETNIISPGNVEVTYAKSDSGKAILGMSENKLDKDNVVNNQTTTEEGHALDARQANPNIDDTLAKQVADLNGSLYGVTSNIFSMVTSDSIEFQLFFETKIGNLIVLQATFHVKQNIASWQNLNFSQYSNENIIMLGGMFQSQNTNKAYAVVDSPVVDSPGKYVAIRTDNSGIGNDDWLRGFAILCITSTK